MMMIQSQQTNDTLPKDLFVLTADVVPLKFTNAFLLRFY